MAHSAPATPAPVASSEPEGETEPESDPESTEVEQGSDGEPDPDATNATDPSEDPTTSAPSADPTAADPTDPNVAATPAPPSPPAPPPPPTILPAANLRGLVRYRLRIHDNPVDRGEAFRCYGGCRQSPTETTYLECLSRCPGFEVDAGLMCGPDEGIPLSVCIERRPAAPRNEPAAGAIVAAVLLNVVLLFSLSSLCNASASQCGLGYRYVPY